MQASGQGPVLSQPFIGFDRLRNPGVAAHVNQAHQASAAWALPLLPSLAPVHHSVWAAHSSARSQAQNSAPTITQPQGIARCMLSAPGSAVLNVQVCTKIYPPFPAPVSFSAHL